MSDNRLTELVCSKILHDIAGPAGAVLNGAEMLEDPANGLSRAEIANLLKTSAEQLTAQLQVFRIAFGALTGGGDQIEIEEVRLALAGYGAGRGYQVEWPNARGRIGKTHARLILNAALVLGEAARKKGALQVSLTAEGKGAFTVAAFGEGIRLKPEVTKALEGKASEPATPSQAPALYLHALARESGCRLTLEDTPKGVALRGSFK